MQYFGVRVLLKRIKAIKFLMQDKTVPLRKKLIIVAGIAYIFMPLDLIPLPFLPVSWVDDVLLWCGILWFLSEELDKYWYGEKKVDLSKKYRGKNVVDDVEYEMKDDKDEDDDQ